MGIQMYVLEASRKIQDPQMHNPQKSKVPKLKHNKAMEVLTAAVRPLQISTGSSCEPQKFPQIRAQDCMQGSSGGTLGIGKCSVGSQLLCMDSCGGNSAQNWWLTNGSCWYLQTCFGFSKLGPCLHNTVVTASQFGSSSAF